MFGKIGTKLVNIVLVQMYTPTTDHDNEKIEKMYDEISGMPHRERKGQLIAIVMGDVNAIVGEGGSTIWTQ